MNQIDTLNTIIKERRSIFPPTYTGEKVSDADINQMLTNANWAPTHKLTQPWRWHVLTDKALERFSEYAGDWYERNVTGDSYKAIKHKKIKANPLRSSHIIAICMKRDPSASIPEWEEIAAVSCAVQNMWLTATALGLGGYWSSPQYALEADEFLGLQADEKCLGLFYVGVPVAELKHSVTRLCVDDTSKWHRS